MKKILIGLIILNLVFSGCTEMNDIEPDTTCVLPEDCENRGIIHPMCVGNWECIDGQCAWICETEPYEPEPDTTCVLPTDCENRGIIHPMCVGNWECIDGQCAWICETEELECNGFQLGETFLAEDGCNECVCTEEGIICTEMACVDDSCVVPEDCEDKGLYHPMCVGEWNCIENQCNWICEINDE